MQAMNRIENFPISFFAMIMGLSGLTIAWERAQQIFQFKSSPAMTLLIVTTLIFFILIVLYCIKLIKYREQVVAELRHPVKLNFFPTISISLLLLAVAYLPANEIISEYLWVSGSGMHLLFTLYVLNIWMNHKHFEIHHMNPAWFIPVVGNVLVPVAGTHLGYVDVSWFFFSIGMVFWIVLMTIIFNRVLFHQPIPDRLLPTMFILIAPPAVGFIAYMKLNSELDAFARILYFSSLFLTLLLFTQIRRFARLQFFLSWWAYSFPTAAITLATMMMYESSGQAFYKDLAGVLLALLTLVLAVLVYRTGKAIFNKKICVSEEH